MIYQVECDNGHRYTQEVEGIKDISHKRPYQCGAGMAYACNGYLIMVPWGKYKIGEYSDETFHPGTAVDSLEVEPSHA